MAKKKGILGSLFGGMSGKCDCGMEIKEETHSKSGGCCNMEIVEQPEETSCCCCGEIDKKEDKPVNE